MKQMNLTQSLFPVLSIVLVCLLPSNLFGQSFDSGSDGSYGAINITTNTTLFPPSNGIFHATTVNVESGATLLFARNALNTPIYILATGDITIDGTIDVSGSSAAPSLPGRGGPGGFDGGKRALPGSPAGAGQGPGGAAANTSTASSSGALARNGVFANGLSSNTNTYGNGLLMPLVGGSGGGGSSSSNSGILQDGGGGGGAILLGSNTKVVIDGKVEALGGFGFGNQVNSGAGLGSGGAVRIVSPIFEGSGVIDTRTSSSMGAGRVRIDTLSRVPPSITIDAVASSGYFLKVFPDIQTSLRVTEVAGNTIQLGFPAAITLPFGASSQTTVKVEATNFQGMVPIQVVLTPEDGQRVVFEDTIDMSGGSTATKTVNVTLPSNSLIHVHVWTKP